MEKIINLDSLVRKSYCVIDQRISKIILINIILAMVSLAKDIVSAWYLGTTSYADAFMLAYFLIDMIGNNLLANALGLTIIPLLARMYEGGEQQHVAEISLCLVVCSLLVSTIFIIFLFEMRVSVLSWVGAGLNIQFRLLSISLFTFLIPSIIIFPLINIGTAIMQVHNRFILPALAPVLFNLINLIGFIYFLNYKIALFHGVYGVVKFILMGQILMLALVWVPMVKSLYIDLYCSFVKTKGFHVYKHFEFIKRMFLEISPELVSLGKSFLLYLLAILFPQITYLLERYIASHLETGTITALNFAFRLVQFPLWVFIAAFCSVQFPAMAKFSAIGDHEGLHKMLMKSICMTSVFTIPFSIILHVLRVPIISIMLERGEFSPHSVVMTANILAGYAFTISWQGFSAIMIRFALVKGRVLYALVAAIVAMFSTVGSDFILVPLIGAAGLGYGAVIGSIVNYIILYRLFYRFSRFTHSAWKGLAKVIMVNIPLFVFCVLFYQVWLSVVNYGSEVGRISYGVVVGLACLFAFWKGLRVIN